MDKTLWSRVLRVIIGLACLALLIWWIPPLLEAVFQSRALVNAPTVDIRSPIDGQITKSPPERGTIVNSGAQLSVVTNKRVDQTQMNKFRKDLSNLKSSLNSVRERLKRIQRFVKELTDRKQIFQNSRVQFLQYTLQERRSQLKTDQANIKKSKVMLDTIKERDTLNQFETENIAKNQIEEARADLEVAKESLNRSKKRVEKTIIQLNSAQKGVFTEIGEIDIPFSQRQIDRLTLEAGELRDEHQRLRDEIQQVQSLIKNEKKRLEKMARAVISAPFQAPVWYLNNVKGSQVQKGDLILKLLDCSRRFVQVIVPESFFSDLSPGMKAQINLYQREIQFEGKITDLYGPNVKRIPTDVAEPLKIENGEIMVQVSIPTKLDQANEWTLCHVGQKASVTFVHNGSWWRWITNQFL